MSKFFNGLEKYIYWTSIPKMGINDIVDIIKIATVIIIFLFLIIKSPIIINFLLLFLTFMIIIMHIF